MLALGLDNMPDIMTVNQLTEFLQISRMTIFRALKNGTLKGFKAGKSRRFEKQEVLKWINETSKM